MKTEFYSEFYGTNLIVNEDKRGMALIKFKGEDNVTNYYSGFNRETGRMFNQYMYNCIGLGVQNSIKLKKVLIVGFGAGSIAHYLETFFPDIEEIHGLEIDKAMIEISDEYLNLKKSKVTIGDAKENIKNLESDTYDLVIMDCYGKDGNFAFWGPDFYEQVKRVLKEKGILTINKADFDSSYFVEGNEELGRKIKDYQENHESIRKIFKGHTKTSFNNGRANDRFNCVTAYNLEKDLDYETIKQNYINCGAIDDEIMIDMLNSVEPFNIIFK